MWGSRKKRGLRNWVVLILRRGPRTGAQIIDDMEVMTHGWWRPSPGSVYPLLEEMMTEGALRRDPDGRYELSPSAREDAFRFWSQSPRTAQEVVSEISGLTSYLEDRARSDPKPTPPIGHDLDSIVQRLERLRKWAQ